MNLHIDPGEVAKCEQGLIFLFDYFLRGVEYIMLAIIPINQPVVQIIVGNKNMFLTVIFVYAKIVIVCFGTNAQP